MTTTAIAPAGPDTRRPPDDPLAPGPEYRPIAGVPGYRVGNDGSVWTSRKRVVLGGKIGAKSVITAKWRRLPCRVIDGYPRAHIAGRGNVRVHCLVLEAFVGPCPPGLECLHGDGDPTNNRLDNLRWGTHAENVADTLKHGRHFTPFARPPVFRPEVVEDILRRHKAGESIRSIAASLGIGGRATVWRVIAGKGVYATAAGRSEGP